MSFFNRFYKKIKSLLKDDNCPDSAHANELQDNNVSTHNSEGSLDKSCAHTCINSCSGGTSPLSTGDTTNQFSNDRGNTNDIQTFKPKVVDNGRTLLLALNGCNLLEPKNNLQSKNSLAGANLTTDITATPPFLSVDDIEDLLSRPIEEEKDAPIVYKLKCSKCDVNGKIDSFTETFVCPLCGGTMYLIEAYANHLQHSPEEIKQELCVLYSKFNRGDSRAQKTWALLISQSHSDRKLEEYMRQYINPHSNIAEKAPSSSSAIVSHTNSESQKTSRTVIGSSTNSETPKRTSTYTWASRIQLSPTSFRSDAQKPIQFPHVARSVNPTVANPCFLIPELEQAYKIVNESYSVKCLFTNNEQSLLRGLGYKVGKSSKLTATDRQKILVIAFVADTSTVNAKWNKPMTPGRVSALISLLRRLNDSDFYKMNDYSVAIKHRKEDIAWLSNYTIFVKEAIRISKTIYWI